MENKLNLQQNCMDETFNGTASIDIVTFKYDKQ